MTASPWAPMGPLTLPPPSLRLRRGAAAGRRPAGRQRARAAARLAEPPVAPAPPGRRRGSGAPSDSGTADRPPTRPTPGRQGEPGRTPTGAARGAGDRLPPRGPPGTRLSRSRRVPRSRDRVDHAQDAALRELPDRDRACRARRRANGDRTQRMKSPPATTAPPPCRSKPTAHPGRGSPLPHILRTDRLGMGPRHLSKSLPAARR